MTDHARRRFVAHHPGFTKVTGPAPRLELVTTTAAHEGPVHVAAEGALYFTTTPRWTERDGRRTPMVTVSRVELRTGEVTATGAPTVAANGMTSDAHGRLVICEQGDHSRPARISRFDPATGQLDVLADHLDGLALNSPNDVVVDRDGVVWFTDPSYGHLQDFRPAPVLPDAVHRLDPRTGRHDIVAVGFDKPNGIALSPDGSRLYVTDSGANQAPGSYHADRPHHVVVFDVVDGHRLTGRRCFATTRRGVPDGLKTDAAGRVYASSADGIDVFGPGGRLLGEIHLPGAVNFCFGGPGDRTLFITTDDAIWAARVAAHGVEQPVPTTPTGATT